MILISLAFTLLLIIGYLSGYVSMPLLALYGVMSAITLALYAIDKSAAVNGQYRIPESRLHLCSLLGGWPGALLAQSLFRHKTRKRSFQIQFWLVSLINGGLLVALIVLR